MNVTSAMSFVWDTKPDFPSPGLPGGWGSFAHAPRPSQGPRHAFDPSDRAGPSIGPFVGDDGGDDTDTNQFIGGKDSP